MFLRSLSLRNFAGSETRDLDGLQPGLNVVVGDNEAGKSTLLLALRSAFFQRHRAQTEVVRLFAPYGRQVRPEVTVEFETGGESYRLRKGFLQKPDAELTWATGSLTGEAVEERLAEIFRFNHSGARKVKEGDYPGAFGLLWADQGRAFQGLDLGQGRDAVAASLEGEVAQVLGGDRGRSLLALAKARHDRFFTDRGRVSVNSPLKAVEDRLADLGRELNEREALARGYQEKIERLHRQRDRLRGYERDDVVRQAERALRAAEETLAGLGALQREAGEAQRALRQAEMARETSAERLKARDTASEALRGAQARAGETAERLSEGEARLAREVEVSTRVGARLEAARAAEERLAAQAGQAARRAEARQLAAELAADDARHARAIALVQERDAVAQPEPGLDAALLKTLDALERAAREAAIRLEGASPVLRLYPLDGRTARTADAPVMPGEVLRIGRLTRLELEGFGAIEIEPGGDGEALGREADRTRRALADKLRTIGASDVDEARRRVRESEERARARERLDAQIRLLVPEGLAALAGRMAARRAQLARTDEPEPVEGAAGSWDEARRELAEAERAMASAGRTLSQAREALGALRSEAAHAEAEARRRGAELAEAERDRPRAALLADLAAADTERAGRALAFTQRREALEAADPDTARRTMEARQRALAAVREDQTRLQAEVATLEGELGAQGLVSLHSEIERLQGEIAAAEMQRQRLSLEAEASRLLHQTLLDAQREARESWLGPIKQRVAPYLRLLHSESDVEFDESTLEIAALRRRGTEERFDRLSMGAREQVAVVTRLALAEVLKRGGHPAAVILDDALVNTDEVRLQRMHMALQRAADTGLQVIVLTCRERDFRDLGAPIIRL
ncbi:AAA family ATPase [Aureimonas sp. AU4]|uniref:AAA family ATPase n=1 Tax=Aureimonas sp. AU4 TaxID=1638163 RepID=UPI0009E69D1A|nr:AAA family ATPase [Aureimonas sp. AU4]